MRIASHCRITPQRCLLNGQPLTMEQSQSGLLTDLYRSLSIGYPKFYKMDNLCKAGFLAAELVVSGSDIDGQTPRHDVAVLCMNSCSSLDDDMQHQQNIRTDNSFPSPAVFVYTLANIVTGEIAIRHKLLGESSFYIAERFSSEQMAQLIEIAFSDNDINCLLCGWIDVLGEKLDVLMMRIDRADGTAPTAENIDIIYNNI